MKNAKNYKLIIERGNKAISMEITECAFDHLLDEKDNTFFFILNQIRSNLDKNGKQKWQTQKKKEKLI